MEVQIKFVGRRNTLPTRSPEYEPKWAIQAACGSFVTWAKQHGFIMPIAPDALDDLTEALAAAVVKLPAYNTDFIQLVRNVLVTLGIPTTGLDPIMFPAHLHEHWNNMFAVAVATKSKGVVVKPVVDAGGGL